MQLPWRKKALTGSANVVDALRDRQIAPFPLLGGGNRQRIQDAYNTAKSANYAWIYTNSPAVRTVVDVIARNMGQLDLRVYEEVSEDERHPDPTHPAALSLRYPNEETSADSFIRSLVTDFLIFDDAYAVLSPAPGGQISLNWVPAHMVEIRGSSLFRAEGYRIWRIDGTWQDIPPDQMLHWHGENPLDPRTGSSKLDTLRGVIAEDAALQQATVELATSGMTEAAYVFRPLDAPQWSNDARRGFEQDLTNRLRRANKTPPVMEEGMELRPLGVSPRDAQMLEIRRYAIERVAALYGVPLGMVGLADNVAEAREEFYADVLPPYCENFTKMLNQRILVRVYDWTDGCFEFNLDEKLMGNERVKTLVAASGRPVMTTDEARAKLNLPPIDGGDELVTPMNVIVGDNPKPSPQVMGPQDPNGPPQDGSGRQSDTPAQPPKALVKAESFEPVPQFHPQRKADLERQHQYIDQARSVVVKHYNRLQRGLMTKAQTDWEVWDKRFSDNIDELLQEIVRTEGSIYAFKLNGRFNMSRVQNYLRTTADGFAKALNDTIRSEIEEFGAEDALALRDRHVESIGAALGARATIFAREEAARQGPNTESRTKTWVPDTQRHAEFGGMTVPIGASWPAGFAPGTAPGCKCTMTID